MIMPGLGIRWNGMRAVRVLRDGRSVLEWWPEEHEAQTAERAEGPRSSRRTWAAGSSRGKGGSVREGTVQTRIMRYEPCAACGSLKPERARYHAPLARPDGKPCPHGRPEHRDCAGRPCPPRCCWGAETEEAQALALEAAGWVQDMGDRWSLPGSEHYELTLAEAAELAREVRP